VKAYGYGGATAVHEITGVALITVIAGKKELPLGKDLKIGRVRKPGGSSFAIKVILLFIFFAPFFVFFSEHRVLQERANLTRGGRCWSWRNSG